MRAVVTKAIGGPKMLELIERDIPTIEADEVLIKVTASCTNKIDLIKRKEQADVILGHECSGHIVEVGRNVTGWERGEEVCALLVDGGGYAEYVAVPSELIFRVPKNITLELAASLPVLACSTFYALLQHGILMEGKSLLIHDGFGGEHGVFALRLAKALYNTTVFVVSDDDEKLYCYKRHGADKCINSTDYDFFQQVVSLTNKRGVDVVLNYGGVNFMKCQRCLTNWGILVVVFDVQEEHAVDLSISSLTDSSGMVMVCDLRKLMTSSSRPSLSWLVKEVTEHVWPLFDEGKLQCKQHMTKPLSMAASAHQLMEKGKTEKIILTTQEKPGQGWRQTSLFTMVGAMMGSKRAKVE